MKNKKRNCDERQVFAPIRAVQMGFDSIIALLFANFFLRDALGSAWAAPEVDMAAILWFSMGAYAARCVWTDAYFTAREDPHCVGYAWHGGGHANHFGRRWDCEWSAGWRLCNAGDSAVYGFPDCFDVQALKGAAGGGC